MKVMREVGPINLIIAEAKSLVCESKKTRQGCACEESEAGCHNQADNPYKKGGADRQSGRDALSRQYLSR